MLQFFAKQNTTESGLDIVPEDKLIDRYRNTGDPVYVGQLFDPYVHLVYGLCLKYLHDEEDCKDAVMQIFENILRDLKTHNVKSFKSWIYIVSKNYCLKIIRRRKQDRKYTDTINAECKRNFVEIDESLNLYNKEKITALNHAVKQLRGPQKQCIELVYLNGKSYKDVVEITGFEMNKVKSYVQNGKRNLRLMLEKLDEFNEDD